MARPQSKRQSRPVSPALNKTIGDPAWDAMMAAARCVRDAEWLASAPEARNRLATARDIVAFTPAPSWEALLQKVCFCEEWVDDLFNPASDVSRREVAMKDEDEWPAAPVWFEMHDQALTDPATALAPGRIAHLASLALTPYRNITPETPYSIFDYSKENSELASRITAFSEFCESFFRAAYLDACALSGEAPPAGMTYPDLADEVAAHTGVPAHMVRLQTDWSQVVAEWERQKALEQERAARSDEEAHAAEDTPEELAAVKAYWEALDALQAATPPSPAELAYQVREQLNASAFHYAFQHAECPDSISDLLSAGGGNELVASTYLAVLRMAGIDSPAHAARAGTPFFPSDAASGKQIRAEWREHHAMRRAVYTALGAEHGVTPAHHQVLLTTKWAEDSGLSPEDVARCHLSPEAFDAYVDSLRKHQPAPAFGTAAIQPQAALMAAE